MMTERLAYVREVRAETRQSNRADENASWIRIWPISVHASFEKVVAELCNAGNDSRQLEELT